MEVTGTIDATTNGLIVFNNTTVETSSKEKTAKRNSWFKM